MSGESQGTDVTTAKVRIVDIDMPFTSMISFMVKWAIAAIPAFILLAVVGFMLSAVFAGFAAALMGTRL